MDHLAPEGPVYQAGTLSGNPLAMAAGIAALELLKDGSAYDRLDRLGTQVREAIQSAISETGIPAQIPQVGSMFCLYFTDTPVENLDDASDTDTERFNSYFHKCLDLGVYIPPSKYEGNFISTAHESSAIERACDRIRRAAIDVGNLLDHPWQINRKPLKVAADLRAATSQCFEKLSFNGRSEIGRYQF